MGRIEVDEKKLDKVLNAFGHNCDYLYQEVYRRYCSYGIINNELQKCKNCKFKNSKLIKDWLKEGE